MSNRGYAGQRGRGGGGQGAGGRGGPGRGAPRGGSPGPPIGAGGRGVPRGGGQAGGGPGARGGRGGPQVVGGGRGSPAVEARGRGFVPRGGSGPRGAPRGRGFGGPVIFAADGPARIPPHLEPASHDQLIKSFKSLKVGDERPLRPGYGTVGTPITLRANFFPVKIPKGPIYDYDVGITPKTDINRLRARIFKLVETSPLFAPHVGYVAHDRSARLVSARKLPQPLDIEVPFYEEGETSPRAGATVYTVSVTLTGELDTTQLTQYMNGGIDARDYNPLPLLSALNLVLQQHAASAGVRVGKNRYFFPSSAEKFNLGLKVEAWKGFFTSVRPTYRQLMVNVNVCMTAFVEPGNVADHLLAFSERSMGAMPTLPKSMVKSIKITTSHLGYKMRKPIKSIATTPARNTFFDCEEFGGRISVENYFRRKYNITLRHPHDLPVIDVGTAKRTNYVPAELCEIESGQPYKGKLNDRETAQMIRHACNPPRVNAESIVNQGLPTLGLTPETLAAPVQGFGITIETKMAVIPGRELRPPRLTYKAGAANVRDGSWNILDVKFQRGARVASWWVLVVQDGPYSPKGPDPPIKALVEGFAAKCNRSGITMPSGMPRLVVTPPLLNISRDPSRTNAIDVIRQTIKGALEDVEKKHQPKPSFILVLLSNRDNYIYPALKRLGDVEFGLHTVHMQLSKAIGDSKKQDQYFSNVALKVNTKLGGMNHLLEASAIAWLTKKKTMVVGIDVTHPGPTSREGTPSIAAVVASVDDSFVQFPASLRIQQTKKEMLDELRDMLLERLRLYEKKNKVLPERIFVYRDGVSEGQFNDVLETELPQIRESFRMLDTKARKSPYQPKLSIIICGKRHHARFYPTDSPYADRNGNTRPGTVVDKGVTNAFDFDFYLQAHAGLQGSVRPTHYSIIFDQNALEANEIQQGTNDVSYLYARATKAVSLVPAAYYADLACERGRCYLNEFLVDDRSDGSAAGRKKGDREEEKQRVFKAAKAHWGEGLHPDIRESMFYI